MQTIGFVTFAGPLSAGLAVLAAAATWLLRRRRRHALLARVRAEWGRPRHRDCDFSSLVDFHRARKDDGPSIDGRTWDDLNMDSVFTILDHTESAVGQQALYHRLRTPFVGPTLDAFDALVNVLHLHPPERERAQMALAPMRDTVGYDIWRLAGVRTLELSSWYVLFPFLGAGTVLALILTPVWPVAIFGAAAGAVTSLLARATLARHLRLVLGSFRQVGPVLVAAETLDTIEFPGADSLVGTLHADIARLTRLRRIAGWVSNGAIFKGLNALFCLDASALFFGSRELKAHGPEFFRVIAVVGEVDAALSIASYRQSTAGWTRPVWREAGSGARLVGIRHPLLGDAVPNTVRIGDPAGMIVTGSNMSGKSTFLRTVGVTAVLAQTINTCLADAYEAPPFVVKSCIGRADDPSTGKSYYLVEVDSVLALVQDSDSDVPHLFLFDELFRGTNAIERIAAGEAVLRALLEPRADGSPAPHVVLAATHDQDLVVLVVGWYVAYHFADSIDDDGLAFDYQLQPGVASKRNAIRLLKMRGAPEPLIARAIERAESLDRQRDLELQGDPKPQPDSQPRQDPEPPADPEPQRLEPQHGTAARS